MEQSKADAIAGRAATEKKRKAARVDGGDQGPAEQGNGKRRKRSPEAIARREAKRKALAVVGAGEGSLAGSKLPMPKHAEGRKRGGKGKPEREVWTCGQCGLEGIWGTRFRCRQCGEPRYNRKKMDRSWVDPKVAGGWKIEQPSSDTLRKNAELRKQYQLNPEAMSEEDRKRAEVLIRRTERKRMKKAKAKAAFLAKKNNPKRAKKRGPVNRNLPSSMDR